MGTPVGEDAIRTWLDDADIRQHQIRKDLPGVNLLPLEGARVAVVVLSSLGEDRVVCGSAKWSVARCGYRGRTPHRH